MAACRTCGEPLDEGVEVCPVCGTKVAEKPDGVAEQSDGVAKKPDGAAKNGFRTRDEWLAKNTQSAGIELGYSKKFDTPEFQAALKASNRTYTRIQLGVLFGGPLLVALAGSLIGNAGAGIIIGASIAVFVVAIPVVAFFLIKRNTAKSWDGEVTDLTRRSSEHSSDTYYITCRTDEGKRRKVNDYGRSMYDYLQIGDRVRFHPRLNVALEKYDKTHDSYLLCPFCGKRQDLENDDCDVCGKPLLK